MSKSVGKNHPEYKAAVQVARKMRALDKGTTAVKNGGEEFLCRDARFSGSSGDRRYKNYLQRAQLIEAIRPTKRLIISRLFEQDPDVSADRRIVEAFGGEETFKRIVKDIARFTATELSIAGRCMVAVEASTSEDSSLALNFFKYKSEAVPNWRGLDDGKAQSLSLVVAEQDVKKNEDDVFCHETVARRLVERIDENGRRVSEQYQSEDASKKTSDQVENINKAQSDGNWNLIADSVEEPTILGDRMDFIPFHIFTTDGYGFGCASPTLEAMGETVLSAFETSAWQRNSLSLFGTPTPYIAQDPVLAEETSMVQCEMCNARCDQDHWNECGGCSSCENKTCQPCDDSQVRLGSDDILMLAGANAKAGFMEPNGKGTADLAAELKRQQEQIVSQGAKMFRSLNQGVNRTATAENNDDKNDTDQIADLGSSVERGMLSLLVMAGKWLNLPEDALNDISFALTRSYKKRSIEWKEIAGVIESWVGGQVPLSIVLKILKEVGYLPADMTEDDYIKAISEFEFEPRQEEI